MVPLQWVKVDSSNIRELRWEDGKLYVRYHHGGVYAIPEVTPQEAEAALHASSPGSFVHGLTKIKPKAERVIE